MKKIIALIAFALIGVVTTVTFAQSNGTSRTEKKSEREAKRAEQKAQEKAMEQAAYNAAVRALNDQKFVLEANQVVFRRGQNAFVTPTTNFVMMNGNRATIQIAFNTPNPGPNGIGGVTVDGTVSSLKTQMDKKGNVDCSFSVQGTGVSAQVFIRLTNGNNKASVAVSPNFNGNRMTLNGEILPLDQSSVFKGRAW